MQRLQCEEELFVMNIHGKQWPGEITSVYIAFHNSSKECEEQDTFPVPDPAQIYRVPTMVRNHYPACVEGDF